MLTDIQLLDLEKKTYSNPPSIEDGGKNIHVTIWSDQDKEFFYVGFKGSVSDRDWFDDIDRALVPRWRKDIGLCHATLVDGIIAVYPAIMKAYWEVCFAEKTLKRQFVVFGHSKGGGEAEAFVAVHNSRSGPKIARLVTWGGCHTIGNHAKKYFAGLSSAQYRNGADPVPPLPWLPFVYKHQGNVVQLNGVTDSHFPVVEEMDYHHLDNYRLAMISAGIK